MQRLRVWIVRVSLAMFAFCVLVWALSHLVAHFDKSFQSTGEFLKTNRRAALRSGYLYVDISRAPSPAEQERTKRLDELKAQIDRGKMPTPWTMRSLSGSRGSGDKWLVIGWHQQWDERHINAYGGATDTRTGLWVSLWGVALLALLPWLAVWGDSAWRRWRIRRRESAGLCIDCGYDLRASGDRCPECGRLITKRGRDSVSAPRT